MASAKDLTNAGQAVRDESVKFRTFKNDGTGLDELKENSSIQGVFISVKDQEITDRRTKLRKHIRVYAIRLDSGKIAKVGSRALLDGIFDDIMDENGGYDVINNRYSGPGIKWIQGKIVKFVRGADTKSKLDGNPMGTYEILVED